MKILPSVLIVDDDNSDVFLTTRILKRSGRCAEVWDVGDGEEALALYCDSDAASKHGGFPPSLILLDFHMPRMDGLELLAACQTQEIALPPVVVMLASKQHMELFEQARVFPGVVGWAVKMIDPQRVAELADAYGS